MVSLSLLFRRGKNDVNIFIITCSTKEKGTKVVAVTDRKLA